MRTPTTSSMGASNDTVTRGRLSVSPRVRIGAVGAYTTSRPASSTTSSTDCGRSNVTPGSSFQ
ncbi:hypothetical protein OJAG_01400 [Oerskovia enterophila]|uniref:Uncharacterized protein n=1 Tax=Oerskovia enterophila TaxID=43678 RepID=A0A163T649_9CELL|nr:hypothetical protein OJAG_01400 [Oerskovia enterophila]